MTAPLIIAAVEFVSPAMLGWLAAATMPWLVNFWSRRRHVESSWAAVELLQAAVRRHSRRLRLREWLLLALRSAIIALVALAASRPYWRATGAAALVAERTHHVVVLDQSFSMTCRTASGTRFDRAQRIARRFVQQASPGDAVTVIAWSATAENMLAGSTFEPREAIAAIDAMSVGDGVADISAALRAARASVLDSRRQFPQVARARVALISDFAANTWAAFAPREPRAGGAATPAAALADWQSLANDAEVLLQSVDDGVRDNLAVAGLSIDTPAPTPETPLRATVVLEAFGTRSWDEVQVELFVDGELVGRRPLQVRAAETASVELEIRPLDRGNHVFEAHLAGDVDAVSADNRRWLSVEVTDGPRVACFYDTPGAAADVARALNPRRKSSPGAIAVETRPIASLAAMQLAGYDAIFLCNVEQLSVQEQLMLRRYASEGGAVVVILGDRIRPSAYNELFAGPADDPAHAGPLLAIAIVDRPIEGDWQFAPRNFEHPILEPFAEGGGAGLTAIRISRYYPARVVGDQGNAQSVLAYSSGDPALVVGDFGMGRVSVLTTDPALASGRPWTTLAVSPSFVPLLRELFEYAAADRRLGRLNRIVGQPLWPLPSGAGASVWRGPDGRRSSTPPATRESGVYVRESTGPSAPNEAGVASLSIAVNVDPAESDLATIDAARVADAPASSATVQEAASTVDAPLQRPLLGAAIVLLFIELAIAQNRGRGPA
jgi:hypothetical protein